MLLDELHDEVHLRTERFAGLYRPNYLVQYVLLVRVLGFVVVADKHEDVVEVHIELAEKFEFEHHFLARRLRLAPIACFILAATFATFAGVFWRRRRIGFRHLVVDVVILAAVVLNLKVRENLLVGLVVFKLIEDPQDVIHLKEVSEEHCELLLGIVAFYVPVWREVRLEFVHDLRVALDMFAL